MWAICQCNKSPYKRLKKHLVCFCKIFAFVDVFLFVFSSSKCLLITANKKGFEENHRHWRSCRIAFITLFQNYITVTERDHRGQLQRTKRGLGCWQWPISTPALSGWTLCPFNLVFLTFLSPCSIGSACAPRSRKPDQEVYVLQKLEISSSCQTL